MLEMGEPVKIVDLAHNMIRLAGYEPEADIAIEFTGPRPGEKLHEELFNSDERPQPTAADKIVRAVRRVPLDPEWVERRVTRLEQLVREGDEATSPSRRSTWSTSAARRRSDRRLTLLRPGHRLTSRAAAHGATPGSQAPSRAWPRSWAWPCSLLLYFAQARDVRRLRENASFLVEGDGGAARDAVPPRRPPRPSPPGSRRRPRPPPRPRRPATARPSAGRSSPARRPSAASASSSAARARRGPPWPGGGDGGRSSWLRETPSIAVIAVGALLLLAGIGFGATRLLGGDDGAPPPAAKSGRRPHEQTKVAVLNSTAEGGLAAEFAGLLKQAATRLGPVTNTESPFDTSVVMFDQTVGRPAGRPAGRRRRRDLRTSSR